jgi:hypothetical protein
MIPSKFNGYSRDGIRLCFAGGGIGEAALIGAALGGGSAAITGGDPLKGALLGGLTGGAGGAMFGAGAAGAGELSAAATAAPTAAAAAPAAIAPTAAVNYGLTAPSIAPGGISALPAAAPVPAAAPTMSQQAMTYAKANPIVTGGLGITALSAMTPKNEVPGEEEYKGALSRFRFNPDTYVPARSYAGGGITALADGGNYDMMVGEQPMYQGMAGGGSTDLGGYSDGGRMLKGPGDGMSDSIPASIAGRRPARLARDEFVVPADVVSHLGNGSSDAGAKQLYAMMDRVRSARTGNKKQGREINARKYLSA